MNVLEAFRIAWSSIVANKLRALLTMLGIIIGVGAVVGMLAIGNGYSAFIDSEFSKIGVGVFYIYPRVDSKETDQTLEPQLTSEDAVALMQPGAAPAVEFIVTELSRNGVVSAGGERFLFGITGANPNYFEVGDAQLGAGRYYSANEEAEQARVAVIGDTVATTLFGDVNGAVGRRISVNNVQFEVVGVSTTEQSALAGAVGQFSDPGEQIYIPYSTASSRLFRNEVNRRVDVDQLTIKVRSVDDIDPAVRQVTAVLRDRHRLTYQNNDFEVSNPEQAARQFRAFTVGFSAFLGIIGGISLLVGGIGIMNIMLVSVAQRTREIGLRKAVGARRRDIMWQFLIEAVVLCITGGALGVALGFGLAQLGNLLFTQVLQAPEARSTVTLSSMILATSISVGIGVFFGLFPAIRAARLDPIKALRNE